MNAHRRAVLRYAAPHGVTDGWTFGAGVLDQEGPRPRV